jgi:hypothetical protein
VLGAIALSIVNHVLFNVLGRFVPA